MTFPNSGWHVVHKGRCLKCGRTYETQAEADAPNQPTCDQPTGG